MHEALAAQKRDIWVDWEDIPPTADWRAEIRSGIEATNAMIFVISPDSVRSKECRVELELALENNKRLIPLMYRMVTDAADQQGMHPSLNSHNWIYLRDEDPFDEGFQTLVNALDTDLAYVRAHTRLLVRAREWDTHSRDGSLLLRGSDLNEAESWLAGSLTAKPAPTQLHSDYIRASREAETVRSRRLLAGVSVALLASLLMGVFAFTQWQQSASNLELANTRGTEVAQQAATSDSNALLAQNNAATADANAILAQNNEATAVYNEALSHSIALAGQAQLDVDNNDPERGVLLAVEALEHYPYTAQAEYALSLAVQNVLPSQVFPGSASFEANVFWAPDNRRLASVNETNGGIDLWDSETGEKITTLTEDGTVVIKAAWSPDGTRLATSADNAFTTVWDANWQPQFKLDGIGEVWSPDGKRIVTYLDQFMVWDAQTGAALYSMGSSEAVVVLYQPVAWSPDSTRLATGDIDGLVTIWDAEDGTSQLKLYGHEDIVNVISWSNDGTRLISGGGNIADLDVQPKSSAYVWDTETGEVIWRLEGDSSTGIVSVGWSPDGAYMYSGTLEVLDIWDAETAANQYYLTVINPEWSPDSSQILSGTLVNNQAGIYDAQTGVQDHVLSSHSATVIAARWSPNGDKIATASLDGTMRVWYLDDRALLSLNNDGYASMSWSADGEALWVINVLNPKTELWDVQSQSLLRDIDDMALAVSPTDGRFVAPNADNTQLKVVSEDNALIATFDEHTSPIYRATWSPDGKEIGSTDTGNTLYIWDAQNGQQRLKMPGRAGYWSPDGTRLLVIEVDETSAGFGKNSVNIRDAMTGEIQAILPVKAQANGDVIVTMALWSPDGMMVATSSDQSFGENGLIEIWDATTWKMLYTLTGRVFSWAPDGKRVAITQQDGAVKIYSLAGELVYSITDPNELFDNVLWSPNGHYIATTDKRLSVKVWRVATSTQDLLDYAQECCVLRPLTEEEQLQFGLTDAGG